MRHIVVTGGAGYVASQLLSRLKNLATKVSIVDRVPISPFLLKSLGEEFRFTLGDLGKDQSLASLIKEADQVIHLAAIVGYPSCDANPEEAKRSNVVATQNIMRWKKSSAKVFFSSTISNYGAHSSQVNEDTPLSPLSLYGETKKLGEEIVLQDPQNIVYRFAGAFGVAPKMRLDNLIHDFCWRAFKGETLSVYESESLRQFVHVQDMASAIVFAIQNWEKLQGNIFNIGTPQAEVTKAQVLKLIAKNLPSFEYKLNGSGSDKEKRNYPISFQKILNTGFLFEKQLEPGIKEVLAHFKKTSMEGNSNVQIAA